MSPKLRIMIILSLLVLLSSLVYASPADDLKLFRDAVRQNNESICQQIVDVNIKNNCVVNFGGEVMPDKPVKENVLVEPVTQSESGSFNYSFLIGLVILLIVMIFVFIQLHRNHGQYHNYDKLLEHVNFSLKKGMSKDAINNRLLSVGWKKKLVQKAFEEGKKLNMGNGK